MNISSKIIELAGFFVKSLDPELDPVIQMDRQLYLLLRLNIDNALLEEE